MPQSDETINKIVTLINQECLDENNPPKIAGSALGLKITQTLPDINFKNYHGLTSFINRFCSDTIVIVGKIGGDNLFSHRERLNEKELINKEISEYTPWTIFTDPRLEYKLYADIDKCKIKVFTLDAETPSYHKEIERMTVSDYKKIAEKFVLKQLNEEERFKANNAMEAIVGDNFWFIFVDTIRNLFGNNKKNELLEFRTGRIKKLFTKRLTNLGFTKARAIELIYDNYESKNKNKINSRSKDNAVHHINSESPLITKKIIHDAIDSMSQNDVRRIWLPLGAIIDALNKK